MGDNMSPADLKAVLGNGATTVAYPYMGGSGFGGFGNGDWSWILLLILLTGGYGFGGGFGGFGGFGGMMAGMDFMYPWLSNGQKEIMQNTNQGFDTLQLANSLNGINSGVQGLSTQLCGCCGDIQNSLCNGFAGVNQTVNSGFANAEIAANGRQMANMQQAFNSEVATLNGFNNMNNALQNCCCENRLGIANLNSTILSENCADRYEAAKNTQSIITNATQNTQAILDKLCQLELDNVKTQLDAKNDKIADLQRENLMKDLQASQVQQTADLRFSNIDAVDSLYTRLSNCPVPTTPVYGRTPIFTCNGNNGCGCNGNF